MGAELYNAYQQKITWTKEQEDCLNYAGNKTLMVKGIAGAGKSLVILARAGQLLTGYSKDQKNGVAVFTFSNTLNSATKDMLKINGEQEDRITVTTLTSYITYVYNAIGAPKLKIYTEPVSSKIKKEAVQAALEESKKRHGTHRFHNLDLQFWVDEFDWMKDMNVSVQDRNYYFELPRRGRGGKVRMSLADRVVAFQLFTYYDRIMKLKGAGDWIDQSLYLIRNSDKIPDKLKFDHILIDEAQDLSLAQMMAAMKLFRKDMVVAMDVNQRIFDKQWTPKLLGIETTTKKLTKPMRTTKQIDNLAESVREKNDGILQEDEKSVRAIPEKEGPIPQLVHLEDLAAEKKYVTGQIKAYLKQNSKVSIGIIASRNSQISTYASWMTDAGIPHEIIQKDSTFSITKPGVKIVNIYNAKGLEFSRVIIPEFIEGNYPYYHKTDDEEEMQLFLAKCRNLVYVGMTRAQFSLILTYSGAKGSRFIGEMDPQCYEAVGLPLAYDPGTRTGMGQTINEQEIKPPSSATRFINWHGNQQDQYEEILQYSKKKEKTETENFGKQARKKEDAKLFDVPELVSMKTEEILKLLLREKKGLDILYDVLVQNADEIEYLQIGPDMTKQFYADFLLYSVDHLFQWSKVEKERRYQFVETIFTKIFKVKNQISVQEHYKKIESNQEYKLYMSRGFELKQGNAALFWQWICYLSELSAKRNEANQFIQLYLRFIMHLAFYINQLLPGAEVGKKQAERRKINEKMIQYSISSKIDPCSLKSKMENPLCRIRAEKEKRQREAEEQKKKQLSLVKYARILLGYYLPDTEDEEDMMTAGRLYASMKEKKIKPGRIVSIFPTEAVNMLEKGILPVLSSDQVRLQMNENEILHYMDYALVYLQEADEESVKIIEGTLFLTNQRLRLEMGRKRYNILYDRLHKAVLYDVMPEIIEFACEENVLFVQTADTEQTYRILKMILSAAEEQEALPMNKEQLSIHFLENGDMQTYIFGIKTLMDAGMPEKMKKELGKMVGALEHLDTALKKYPGYEEQCDSFFTYYIPEAVRILYSYQEYEKAGIEKQEINPVYEKVMEAIQKLEMAAKQQVMGIYKKEILDTTARAEALSEILGQDGYVDPAYKING